MTGLKERIDALRPRAMEFTKERAGFEDGLDAVVALLSDPELTHADHDVPDEDCFDCQEAVAQMWAQMMEPC